MPLAPATSAAGGSGGAGPGPGGRLLMLTVTRLTADLARTLDFHLTTHIRDPSSSTPSRHGLGLGTGGGLEGGNLATRSHRLVPCDDPDAADHGGLMRLRRTRGQDNGSATGAAR